MNFYNNFIRTFTDLPNHTTLLVHSLAGCPLHCLGCHNYDEIIASTPPEHKTCEDLFGYLKRSGLLFDAVMFSGGEFLISPMVEIRNLLRMVRGIFNGKIIITTSGMYDNKIEELYADGLADGIHIDMKLPYHALDVSRDKQIFRDVMGITPSQKMVDKLLRSVELVIAHSTMLDQVRTVRYPILDDAFFEAILQYVDERKAHHHSNVPYFLNEFQYTRSD